MDTDPYNQKLGLDRANKVAEFLRDNGVAPGQAVVLYDGDQVFGGGWIE